MRSILIAGNWKQNGDSALLSAFAAALDKASLVAQPELALCVPAPLLALAKQTLADVSVGAQNVSAYPAGAYTGEIDSGLLAELSVRYVIVGHSERRSLFGETNADVAEKTERALAAGLAPIICVGETLAEREAGQQEQVVAEQLAAVKGFAGTVVAYEPVWAIGTGLAATTDQAQAMHAFIRGIVGADVQVLYGGSMKPGNAAELLAQPDIDGGLIGGASLSPEDFVAIANSAA